MSQIKLFSLAGKQVSELTGREAKLERDLQEMVEANMETLLGVRFLATEYTTGKIHNGRIDSLGLDENGFPVIVEYKRDRNASVINQGLFYLDWLLDHKADFQLLVMGVLGHAVAESIDWSGTRLLCIAADFNRYDQHTVRQIDKNVELIRYRFFGEGLLLLDLVNAQTASRESLQRQAANSVNTPSPSRPRKDPSQEARLKQATPAVRALFEEVCDFAEGLGDEVQRKDTVLYTAFKRLKNFLSIVVHPTAKDPRLKMYLKLPGSMAKNDDFTRDVSQMGHWGTGDFEVTLRNAEELDEVKRLIQLSFEQS